MITGGAAPDQLNARPARLHPRPASLLFDLQQLQTLWKHTHTKMSPIVWSSGAQASGERIERETKTSPFPTVHPWSCLSCLSELSHTALRWPRGPGSIRTPAGRSLKRLLESGLIAAALLLWSQTLGEKGYECLRRINYTPSAEELHPWERYLTTQCAELMCAVMKLSVVSLPPLAEWIKKKEQEVYLKM